MSSTLVKANVALAFGQALIEDCLTQKNNYFYAVGRSHEWDDENAPPNAIDTEKYDLQSRNDILYLKRLSGASVSFVIPRVDYTPNVVYDIYDDSISLEDKNFYVMNSNFNVYKCLYNANGGQSTVEPFGISNSQVTYSDGYVWKFVYTIPPALRNKFLTKSSIPIYNSITEKYYSRGSISNIIVESAGSGYPSTGAIITVSGDGYLEDNPKAITDLNMTKTGAGYTTNPTVETADIFSASVTFSNGLSVSNGTYIKMSDSSGVRFYLAESSGILSSVAPTHYYTTVNNGTVSLKHVGTKPKIIPTITATGIGKIIINESGFGYQTPPTITPHISGSGATFSSTLTSGQLSGVVVDTNGSGYTNTSITVAEPYTVNTTFAQSTTYVIDDIVKFDISGETYYYRVDVAGISGTSNPTHTSGSQMNGDVMLTVVAKRARATAVLGVVSSLTLTYDVNSISIIDGGSGWTDGVASVTFSGGSATYQAQGNAIISGGKVSRIVITYPGYGYTSTPTISISGSGVAPSVTINMQSGYGYQQETSLIFSNPDTGLPTGELPSAETVVEKTEAILEPIVIDGKVRGVNVVDGGVGYTTATLIVSSGTGSGAVLTASFTSGDLSTIQAQTELFAIHGTVSSIKILTEGSNIATLTATVNGDGSGAVVTPILQDNKLKELLVTNAGSGYTYATINFSVTGVGAVTPTTRVILSPINGHGYNPLKELYAKSVSFYGVFSNEVNNGFAIDASYRQISIYRNPLAFSTSTLLESRTASTCFNVVSSFSGIPLSQNDIFTRESDDKQFRVVDFTSTNALLQSLSNTTLNVSDVLKITINNIEYSATLTSITPPQVDKFSGELLFVDNVSAFQPSDTQSISVNTTFNLV